jgi:hypothetical protein
MVFSGSTLAAELLCYAFHRDMLFPNFQWILHDITRRQLVRPIIAFHVDCTRDQMITATEGVILNQYHLTQSLDQNNNVLPVFQKTYQEYYADYLDELNGTDPSIYGNTYYDAVWAMVLAMHNASENGVDLTSYTYNRNNDTKVIAEYLSQVHFNGVSGPISFQEDTRSTQTVIDIIQLRNGNEWLVGTFDRSLYVALTINDSAMFIQCNETIPIIIINRVHNALGALVTLLAVIIIMLTVSLHVAYAIVHHHNTNMIMNFKTTIPTFTGCYLLLTFLIILSLKESFGVPPSVHLCNAMMWCLVLGYSFILNTLCVQLWRVYTLFRHFRSESRHHFAFPVLMTLLLSIDMLTCVLWTVIDPLTPRIVQALIINHFEVECWCSQWSTWIGTVAIIKGTLLCMLIVSAILNHRSNKRNVQNVKHIVIFAYLLTLVGCVGFPLYYVLHESLNWSFIILSSVPLFTAVACLTIFFPPVIAVLKEKRALKSMQDDTRLTPYGG